MNLESERESERERGHLEKKERRKTDYPPVEN